MSRFAEGDDDYDLIQLDQGRWERNSRATLKSKRGRAALREIRDALLALPEHRLIEGALCTVGGVDRVPEITDEDVDQHIAGLKEAGLWTSDRDDAGDRERVARFMREDRDEERQRIARSAGDQGCGVCVNGALIWYRKVKAGADPAEAFASLPTIADADDGDPMGETAGYASKEAGLAFTLAWNLAYRNDETYRDKTPEERYTAFLAWIENELGEPAEARS